MTAKDCLIGRRSIRQFTEKTVSREVLESIVETASNAPSWKNTQITRYIALEGDQKNEVAMNTMAWNQKIIEGAPMLIAVSMVTGICGFERDG
ncbi:MAG: nitroreductase family protein, partial [Clostridium sp.]|nr:nitroreductase family protein [Clostridium sp.]